MLRPETQRARIRIPRALFASAILLVIGFPSVSGDPVCEPWECLEPLPRVCDYMGCPPYVTRCEWVADSTYIYCGPLVIQLPQYSPDFYVKFYQNSHRACERELVPVDPARDCLMLASMDGAQTNGDDLRRYDHATPCPDDLCTYYQMGYAAATAANGPYELTCSPGPAEPIYGAVSLVPTPCPGHGFVTPLFETIPVALGVCKDVVLVQSAVARDLVNDHRWCAAWERGFPVCNGTLPASGTGGGYSVAVECETS